MTCRFEEEFNHKPYPKSCPTCGLAGKCSKGYTQIKNEGKPGYAIQAPNGQVNFYGPLGQPEGAQGPIGVTMQAPPAGATGPKPAPIPERMGYTNDDPKPVRVIDTERRLMLIGYLVGNNVKRNSVKEYDDMVDAIASILLD